MPNGIFRNGRNWAQPLTIWNLYRLGYTVLATENTRPSANPEVAMGGFVDGANHLSGQAGRFRKRAEVARFKPCEPMPCSYPQSAVPAEQERAHHVIRKTIRRRVMSGSADRGHVREAVWCSDPHVAGGSRS